MKKTAIEDTSGALDVLDGLTSQMDGGNLNIIMAFSKSAENLLTDGLDAETLKDMQSKMASNEGDDQKPCKDTECNNGGKDGNTSKCSTKKTD